MAVFLWPTDDDSERSEPGLEAGAPALPSDAFVTDQGVVDTGSADIGDAGAGASDRGPSDARSDGADGQLFDDDPAQGPSPVIRRLSDGYRAKLESLPPAKSGSDPADAARRNQAVAHRQIELVVEFLERLQNLRIEGDQSRIPRAMLLHVLHARDLARQLGDPDAEMRAYYHQLEGLIKTALKHDGLPEPHGDEQ